MAVSERAIMTSSPIDAAHSAGPDAYRALDAIGSAIACSSLDLRSRVALSSACRAWYARLYPPIADPVSYAVMLVEEGWSGGVRRIQIASEDVEAFLDRIPVEYAASVAAMLFGYHPDHGVAMMAMRTIMSLGVDEWTAYPRSVPPTPRRYRRYLLDLNAAPRGRKDALISTAAVQAADCIAAYVRTTLHDSGDSWNMFDHNPHDRTKPIPADPAAMQIIHTAPHAVYMLCIAWMCLKSEHAASAANGRTPLGHITLSIRINAHSIAAELIIDGHRRTPDSLHPPYRLTRIEPGDGGLVLRALPDEVHLLPASDTRRTWTEWVGCMSIVATW